MKLLKVLIILIITLTLVGCQSEEDYLSVITEVAEYGKTSIVSEYSNMDKGTYSYYLPFGVGRIISDELYSVFEYYNTELLMIVNVPNVIKDRYYITDEEIENVDSTVVLSSSYLDKNNFEVNYDIKALELDGDNIYLELTSRYLTFSCIVDKTVVKPVMSTMLDISKTVNIKHQYMAEYFSNKDVISEETIQQIEIFQQDLPSSGFLTDLLNPQNPLDKILGEEEND